MSLTEDINIGKYDELPINQIVEWDAVTMSPLPLEEDVNELINPPLPDDLNSKLVDSIRKHGLHKPIDVVHDQETGKKLAVGSRMALRACREAGIKGNVPVRILPHDIRLSKTAPELRDYALVQLEIDDLHGRIGTAVFGRKYSKTAMEAMAVRLKDLYKYSVGLKKRILNLKSQKNSTSTIPEEYNETFSGIDEASKVTGVPIQRIKARSYVDKHGTDEIKQDVAQGKISSLQAREQIREEKRSEVPEPDMGTIDVEGLHKCLMPLPGYLKTITKTRFSELEQPDQERIHDELQAVVSGGLSKVLQIARSIVLQSRGANNE